MPAIQLYNGMEFCLDNPDYTNVSRTALTLALARMPRFSTHWRAEIPWYSVAQHSVNVARHFPDSLQGQLAALLHDAHEPFWGLGDICRPAWQFMSPATREEIRGYQRKHQLAVFRAFGCMIDPDDPQLREADDTELARERRDVMATSSVHWETLPEPDDWQIEPLAVGQAVDLYYRRITEVLEALKSTSKN